jgi:K+-transporting ATPase c subunit
MSAHSDQLFNSIFENKFSVYEGFSGEFFPGDQVQIHNLHTLLEHHNGTKEQKDKYDALRGELEAPSGSKLDSDHNDFAANAKLDIERLPTEKDAVQEDINEMIVQQNNTYILGMVTVTTLLVSTFLFMRQ